MLTYGEDVAVWIFEPCHLVTRGSGPNAEFAIFDEEYFSKETPRSRSQVTPNVVDFPSQDGALQGREIRYFCNANAVPADAHHQRVFLEETRMHFGQWRQQFRLLHALQLLASGEKVTAAALEAGYNSPSAFIAMFRKQLGTTPKRYLESEDGRNHRLAS